MSEATPPIAVVSGANRGLGYALAHGLLAQGMHLVLHARTEEKARTAVARLKRSFGEGTEGRIEWVAADMANPEEVRSAAETIRQRHPAIHLLVNNAGLANWARNTTPEGFEETLAVNHFGYVRFTEALLPALVAGDAHIVSVSSGAHARTLDLGILEDPRRYRGTPAYAQSKLLNLIHAFDLARRLEATGVRVNAVHPGLVSTGILMDFVPPGALAAPFRWVAARLGAEPEVAAGRLLPILTANAHPTATGRYFRKGVDAEPAAVARDRSVQDHVRQWTCDRISLEWGVYDRE